MDRMEMIMTSEAFMTEIMQQGIWAVLYVTLFVYTLRESRRQQDVAEKRETLLKREQEEFRREGYARESKLMDFINETTKQYERIATGVERLTMDVDEIKDELKLRSDRAKRENEKGE